MSIKQAFLALLSHEPMHGYQLRQEFEARTGSTWPLNIGQAYTTLQRLERDGLVAPIYPDASDKGIGDDDRDAPERFTLTKLGQQAVDNWWTTPVERATPARDELAIKLALAVTIPGVDVRRIVQIQRTATLRTLRDFTRLKATADTTAPEGLAWSLVLDSLIFAAEAEVRWLDHIETAVTRAALERAKKSRGSASAISTAKTAKHRQKVTAND